MGAGWKEAGEVLSAGAPADSPGTFQGSETTLYIFLVDSQYYALDEIHALGLERWCNSERWMLVQRNQVGFPALTWWLTTIC